MRRKKRITRFACAAALLVLAVTAGIGGVYAWNAHSAAQENNLQSRNASVAITENVPNKNVNPGGSRQKVVAFKNTGTAAVFVRFSYVENWQTGTELVAGPSGTTLNWAGSLSSNWEKKSDGWYYYKSVLPAGGSTPDVLKSVTFPASCPDGADYRLDFQVETVQVSDEAAVNTAATSAAFGRSASVSGAVIQNGAVVSGSVSWN